MIVLFGAFHINIGIALVGFFLSLVVAFASRRAARFALLEAQDCIGPFSFLPFVFLCTKRKSCSQGDSRDSMGGHPNIAVTPVTAVTAFCENNLPAVPLSAVSIANAVLTQKGCAVLVEPFCDDRG